MKQSIRLLCALAVLALTISCSGIAEPDMDVTEATQAPEPAEATAAMEAEEAAMPEVAEGTQTAGPVVTREGSFLWSRDTGDETGDLRAVLTPDGENTWTVAFHFDWEGEPRVFLGNVSGSLSDGPLEGTAESDDENHKIRFRFSGDVENGTFTGTHGFVQKDGTLVDGGTLTLGAASVTKTTETTEPMAHAKHAEHAEHAEHKEHAEHAEHVEHVETAARIPHPGDVTLKGAFVWAREQGDETGDLTAVMTPTGENAWTIAFHFDWEGKPRTFLGTASGSLSDGPLEGTAEGDDQAAGASFRFNGDFENGAFTGTHSFVEDDGTVRQGGTLTFGQAD